MTIHPNDDVLEALEPSDLLAIALDADGGLRYANRPLRDLLLTAPPHALLEHLRRDLAMLGAGTQATRSEQLLERLDGTHATLRWHAVAYPPQSEAAGLLAIGQDVTESVVRESELASLALHDPLTGLPNRTLLADRLAQALRAAQRQSAPCALITIDLEGVKRVNDEHGQDAGDALLREIGPRVSAQLRGSDTVARLGGDAFAILLPHPADALSALTAANKVSAALAEPFTVNGTSVALRARLGIALYPDHALDPAGLSQAAEVAMEGAKRAKRAVAVYDTELDLRSRTVVERVDSLRRAISSGGLLLEFQPSLDLRRGTVDRAEALLRWRHPALGLLRPPSFLPLAERSGLTRPLLDWVLAHALAGCVEWRALGIEAGVSVNLSLRELIDPELSALVRDELRSFQLPPAALTLEFSERSFGREPRRIEHALSELAGTGVRIALDDFGSGDVSLRGLRALPIDEMKLDGRLVSTLCTDHDSWALVRGGIDLGHDLGIEVVAKGVEDAVTKDLLARLGCDVGQGHFFARPVGSRDLPATFTALAGRS